MKSGDTLKAIVRPKVILETMAKIEGCEKHVCDSTCKYWRFPHLDRACVLSDVFSVCKGEMCTEHQPNAEGHFRPEAQRRDVK